MAEMHSSQPSVSQELKQVPYKLPSNVPQIPEQPKQNQPELIGQATESTTGESRKRTASKAELDVPNFKKTKVDEAGTILLDDDDEDDDDLEIL